MNPVDRYSQVRAGMGTANKSVYPAYKPAPKPKPAQRGIRQAGTPSLRKLWNQRLSQRDLSAIAPQQLTTREARLLALRQRHIQAKLRENLLGPQDPVEITGPAKT